MSDKSKLISIVILAIFSIIGVLFLWMFSLGVGFGGTTETWSHFGSFFGGVLGPALAFFSFVGVIFTVYLQSQSNKEQTITNSNAANDRLESVRLQKELQEESKTLFDRKIKHEKQIQLQTLLVKDFDEIEMFGNAAINEIVNPDRDNWEAFNTYVGKIYVFAPMIRMAMKKVDNDYEEILYLYSRRCLGQINKLKHLLISSDLQLEDIEHFNCDIQNAYNNIKDVFEARSHKYSE
ncbi:hypothetical protein [Pseudoalteromonas sp.]|uniref:hypothetical protein n=4 Tax=Pseudoalteromonas TaxID=53246 RepID=UPI003F9874CB